MANGNDGISWQWIAQGLLGILLMILGFFSKNLYTRVHDIELKQAENNRDIEYIKKGVDDIRESLSTIHRRIDNIGTKS